MHTELLVHLRNAPLADSNLQVGGTCSLQAAGSKVARLVWENTRLTARAQSGRELSAAQMGQFSPVTVTVNISFHELTSETLWVGNLSNHYGGGERGG